MKTYTLLQLLDEHSKIEIPIIQRNYVQGDNGRIRRTFTEYLMTALIEHRSVELDFVYGSVRGEVFIPLDGQQRLTTLWLLHCYLLPTAQEERKAELVGRLQGLVYETRPAAKDFCTYLLRAYSSYSDDDAGLLTQPSAYIQNKSWFDPEWRKEATVKAMLGMLDEFAQWHDRLVAGGVTISALSEEKLISFYYLPIQNFGLTNDLYIRMNARGEQLTPFEHFKSSLYKALADYPRLAEIKDKMEHQWVEDLWDYRGDKYVIDTPFMHFLDFVNEVTHIKLHGAGNPEDYKALDSYTEISFIQELYGQEDKSAADRLIASLDSISELKKIEVSGLYQRKSFREAILGKVMQGKLDNADERVLLYSALAYIQQHKTLEGIEPFLRVVRNLSLNTNKRMRELPQIYPTIDRLVQHRDIYAYLAGAPERLKGLSVPQQAEEEWKAKLRLARDEFSSLLDEVEDYFDGKIDFILLTLLGLPLKEERKEENWIDADLKGLDLSLLSQVFKAYEDLERKDRFASIFGDLLLTDVYQHDTWRSRVVCNSKDWRRQQGLISWLISYVQSGLSPDIEKYCIQYERAKLKELISNSDGKLETLRNPKEQLFIYYVITCRLMGRGERDFFANGHNFGWITKEKGYVSLFTGGIENCRWFFETPPIYQTYDRQFRYNIGLQDKAALPPETVGSGRLREPLQKLREWAKEA